MSAPCQVVTRSHLIAVYFTLAVLAATKPHLAGAIFTARGSLYLDMLVALCAAGAAICQFVLWIADRCRGWHKPRSP